MILLTNLHDLVKTLTCLCCSLIYRAPYRDLTLDLSYCKYFAYTVSSYLPSIHYVRLPPNEKVKLNYYTISEAPTSSKIPVYSNQFVYFPKE